MSEMNFDHFFVIFVTTFFILVLSKATWCLRRIADALEEMNKKK